MVNEFLSVVKDFSLLFDYCFGTPNKKCLVWLISLLSSSYQSSSISIVSSRVLAVAINFFGFMDNILGLFNYLEKLVEVSDGFKVNNCELLLVDSYSITIF